VIHVTLQSIIFKLCTKNGYLHDSRLSLGLPAINYIKIVEVLLLAQVPCVDALFTCHEQFKAVLLFSMNDHTDNGDAEEKDLQGPAEHSASENLGKE
jgi:hypothetical protein